ncbi:MAG: substrate-binding domain-containing protein [Actinobacteria bacterium]|nr:substrate-binding domain-containing protein [Actinomycetota bacterium]
MGTYDKNEICKVSQLSGQTVTKSKSPGYLTTVFVKKFLKGDIKVKKYFCLLIVVIFAASMLLFGVSCKAAASTTTAAETTAAATTAAAETTAAAGEKLFISVVAHNDVSNPYEAIIGNGVKQAGLDYGVDVEFVSPPKIDAIAQMALIDGALAKGAKGLGIMVADPDALVPKIKEITAKGTPVVLFQGGAQVWKEAGALCFIGGDSYSDGQFVAKKLIDDGAKNIAIDNHVQGELNIEVRDQGFKDYADSKGVKWTEIITDVTSVENTKAAYKAAFLKDPTIDGITGGWAGISGLAIVPVLEELGLLGKVEIGIMDFTPEYLQLIKDGKVQWSTTLQQWTNGYYAVAFLVNKIKWGVAPTGEVLTGPFIIDKTNVDSILAAIASGAGTY